MHFVVSPFGTGIKGCVPLNFAKINPNSSAKTIHITFPPLTDEQRATMIRLNLMANRGEAGEGKDLLISAESAEQLMEWAEELHNHVSYANAVVAQGRQLSISAEALQNPKVVGGGQKRRISVMPATKK